MKWTAKNGILLSVCTFNLHGKEENDGTRLRAIAERLSELKLDLCALQEVVVDGDKNTAERLAEMLEGLTGEDYRVHFVESHLFYEMYPEGVAVVSRYPFREVGVIDLNDLGELSPLLPRHAAVSGVEVEGRRILFVSVHLDHHKNPLVRKLQVERLLEELESHYSGYAAVILAGDFNDTEDSPALRLLKENGFIDAYRTCNDDPGYTFPAPSPSMRIDYILVKGGLEVLYAGRIMEEGLSDHLGVYSILGEGDATFQKRRSTCRGSCEPAGSTSRPV
ncbi:hypothetical protein A3L14_07475 [Thermococcus thioreducens]|uniref:Metal-dependent hydrolase, endonuclease/exonuclease/phosphatase family n=2 Tax=Thermococcus thioreducens TaxID=277988 RepID=A0A0Q2UN08_9EURY|nr:hypothetical protein A3L14_07475 [Thermococcus thioreducens]KQH82064.1 hypothetical protein AMR53_08250 [Thermococcus thioreducens]SEV86017.1 Metal-dependent hydrolase, endonuclease/exonuclease/phosphatase family [Thermococcus thioreducens]